MEKEIIKRNDFFLSRLVTLLAVVLSVFSQIESIENYTRIGMYLAWGLVLILGLFRNKGRVSIDSFSQRFLFAYIIYCVFIILTGLIDSNHFSSNYFRVLVVPLVVTIAGGLYSDEEKSFTDSIVRVYLISSVIFGIWVQSTYFPSYSYWLSSRVYVFQQKNSAGQIWVSAIFASLFLLEFKNKLDKVIIYLLCSFLFIMTCISQCRTAILGFGFAIICFALSKAKHKFRWIIILGISACALWFIPFTHRFIEQALFLNKYAGADLNTFTSGRIDGYTKAWNYFITSPIIGVGKYYVDNSYISILVESGVIGFAIIEYIWIKKMFMCLRFNGDTKERGFLFVIIFFYFIESLLEGYPPFGPGVSSFMFWFLSSILINKSKYSSDDISDFVLELPDSEGINE